MRYQLRQVGLGIEFAEETFTTLLTSVTRRNSCLYSPKVNFDILLCRGYACDKLRELCRVVDGAGV